MRECVVSTQKSMNGLELPMLESLEPRQFLSAAPHNFGQFFTQTNLVTNPGSGVSAAHTDPNLKNPWGVAFSATSPFWIANNGTGTSTLYDSNGNAQPSASPLTVTIPGADGQDGTGTPTGIVFNGGGGFEISKDGKTGSSLFIFVGEDGVISGWNPQVDLHHAVLALNDSDEGAVYKGATLGKVGGSTFLYITDFHNGKIAVYDSQFHDADLAGDFSDSKIPAGFAPFNISNIHGRLYVTYAKQDDKKHDDVAGPGNGFVDVFDTSGHLLQRFQSGPFLNSPWGLAQAPDGYGKFSEDILVGQFGSGQIAAFDPESGRFRGLLRDASNKPIQIDGLWTLTFHSTSGSEHNSKHGQALFFTAGLNDEADGLFGKLTLNHGRGHHHGRHK